MVFGLFRKKSSPSAIAAEALRSVSSGDDHSTRNAPGRDLTVNADHDEVGPFLWQDVAYGMTFETVRSIRPDAIAKHNVRKLEDGAMSGLAIPHLNLAGHDYTVLFYFRNNRLTQVTIATNGNPTMVDFEAVTGALRLRYGREVEYTEVNDGLSKGEWLSTDGINVWLVCWPDVGILNINFQNRYSDAALQL